jgi:hypothetical protein
MQANQQSSTPAILSKTAAVRTIKEAYAELSYLNLQDGFKDVAEYLFDKNLAAERQHRKGAPYNPPIRHGITANVAAKLFTVSHLLDGFAEPNKWTVDAILSIRNEVLYAQAYANKFHKELAPWARKWAEPFRSIDYAELMKA